MKILSIASWYPTKRNPNFGIFIKEHAKSINSAGCEIVVIGIVIHRTENLWSKTIADSVDENGVRTVLIEINTRFRDIIYHAVPLQYCLLKKTFRKQIQSGFEPDIIHSNVIFPAGIIGDWLAKSIARPHVITEHWTRVRNFAQVPVLSIWGKKAYTRAARILPVSQFLQHEIQDSFIIADLNKFKVVGNVIDSNTFTFKEKVNNPNELRLCAIATWAHLKHPAKQPELLINALSVLQNEISQTIMLIMVGGGDKVEELKTLCLEKGVKAEFTGYLEKLEIVKRLQNSDFFVHATTIETFGVVVAEALLTGTPVVCSNVSALKELINENNGELCENTVEDWVRGLKRAIGADYNKKQIAMDIKQRYDIQNIGNQIRSVYQEILD
jgi:glycosyltransferase involved in cell wall biosynthesis